MKTKSALLLIAAFALGVLAPALRAATESIETSIKNLIKAVDAGDRTAGLAYGPTSATKFPVRVYDYDWDNKFVSYEGAEAVNSYIGSLFDELAKRKIKVASVVSDIRTGINSPEMGFASFEVTQTMTVDGKSESTKFRVTTLMNQDSKSGKWRLFYWHATLVPPKA